MPRLLTLAAAAATLVLPAGPLAAQSSPSADVDAQATQSGTIVANLAPYSSPPGAAVDLYAALDPTVAPGTTGVLAEVAAGVGGDSTGTGYAVVRADFSATAGRPSRPLDRRGLVMCSLDEAGCLWVFTGLDADAPEGVGVAAHAELLYPQALTSSALPADASTDPRTTDTRTLVSSTFFGGEAWASVAGWRAAAQANIQPVGTLRDRFWRSGRGILEGRTILDVPGMWSIGTKQTQAEFMPWHVELGSRVSYDGSTTKHAGFDRDISVVGARVYSSRLRFDFLSMSLAMYGVDRRRVPGETSTITYGNSADILTVDIGDLVLRLAHGITARAYGGLMMLVPISPFKRQGNSEHSYGPSANTPHYWGELAHTTPTSQLTLGGGSWSRLDPTGHAVDRGQLGTASWSKLGKRVSLKTELSIGKLRRVLIGLQAPDDIAPVGTRAWMGRASIAASILLRRNLALEATAWAERSDRDDPRWRTRATTDVAMRAGADVSASWRFQRKRR